MVKILFLLSTLIYSYFSVGAESVKESLANSQQNVSVLPDLMIQMHLTNVPIKDIFELLGKLGNVEMIGHEKIPGFTSVHFQHIHWRVAFAYLLSNHGLQYLHHNNSIIIGSASELADIHKLLSMSSKLSNPILAQQVLIEARIVEADYRFARNLGIKLGYQDLVTPQFQTKSIVDLSAGGLNGFETPVTAITMLKKGATSVIDLELSALESDGKGNIIANPRIITANKTLATIEQGTELPYQSSSKDGSKVQFRKANLKLEVTPIIEDQHILLHVEISKDSVGMKTEQGFAINTKHLKSQILVEDGATVVIGGIYLQTEREDIVKIPFLGDIPYLGKFFQHNAVLKDKTELLVFLTPSLMDHQGNNPFTQK